MDRPDIEGVQYDHADHVPHSLARHILEATDDSWLTTICVYSGKLDHRIFEKDGEGMPGDSTRVHVLWVSGGALVVIDRNRLAQGYHGHIVASTGENSVTDIWTDIRRAVECALSEESPENGEEIFVRVDSAEVGNLGIDEDELELPEEVNFQHGSVPRIFEFGEPNL